jgi:hypothetical protein
VVNLVVLLRLFRAGDPAETAAIVRNKEGRDAAT